MPGTSDRRTGTPELVLASGALLIGAQLVLRGWALLPSWFMSDDYRLLHDARARGLSWSYLVSPFDSQLMPWGRLLAWFVDSAGGLDWRLAAALTLAVSALTSAACLWMLVTLFGARWGVLAPLSVYLFGAMTVPALMWWAASLNQLPLQAVLFAGVGCGVRHLRSGSPRWLALTLLVLLVGFSAYVKTVLVLLVLAYLAVAYFGTGSPAHRLLAVLRRYRAAVAVVVLLGVGYAAAYLGSVPQAFGSAGRGVAVPLLRTLVGESFATAAVGGPLRWSATDPPIGAADPPRVLVAVAWLVIAAVVVHGLRTRTRTLRAWGLLAGYLVVVFVLLLGTRAAAVGPAAGLQYRYLSDVAGVLCLCVGLAFLPLLGADESSAPRTGPARAAPPDRRWLPGLAVLVAVLGTVSAVRYASLWHDRNYSELYVRAAQQDLQRAGTVDLAEQVLPDYVMPRFTYPADTTSRLVPLLTTHARFPAVSPDLRVLADDGSLRRAVLDPEVTSTPGPVAGCGWQVHGSAVQVPLRRPSTGTQPWVRIGYLASKDAPVTLTLGSRTVRTEVRSGLNSLFVRSDAVLGEVGIDVGDAAATVCVDTVEVGDVDPGPEEGAQ